MKIQKLLRKSRMYFVKYACAKYIKRDIIQAR